MNLLEIRDVGVEFGGLQALSGLSFVLRPGQIKGVIGPNGAGKTTLFNVIVGVQRPTTGDVRFEERSILDLPSHARAALGMARTFQNLQIVRGASLLENVMIGRHPRMRCGFLSSLLGTRAVRREEDEVERLAYEKLEMLGLADRAWSSAAGLSFGEAKLLEIARALVADPRVLLLDEPAAGVPHGEQAALSAIIRRVNAAGITVLLVEHNMKMVMNLCDEILVLQYGRWLAEGTPAAVSRDPQVIGAYLGAGAADA
jgi:branched-chain amino acid transport system ATP-binding protein